MKLITIYLMLGFVWLSYASLHRAVPLHLTLKQRQAAALKDVYNITDEEVAAPVRLFGD